MYYVFSNSYFPKSKYPVLKKEVVILLFFLSATVFSQDWKPSYKEALTCSKEEDKPIILVFSGSDWCAPCIKLDKTIWQSKEFIAFSKDNYILYRADFPRKKANKLSDDLIAQNNALADKFNAKGYFPLVVVLSPQQKILGTTGYKKLPPEAYISLLSSLIK